MSGPIKLLFIFTLALGLNLTVSSKSWALQPSNIVYSLATFCPTANISCGAEIGPAGDGSGKIQAKIWAGSSTNYETVELKKEIFQTIDRPFLLGKLWLQMKTGGMKLPEKLLNNTIVFFSAKGNLPKGEDKVESIDHHDSANRAADDKRAIDTNILNFEALIVGRVIKPTSAQFKKLKSNFKNKDAEKVESVDQANGQENSKLEAKETPKESEQKTEE